MLWTIEWDAAALKETKKLGHTASALILAYVRERLQHCDNPRAHGSALTADKVGLWRYRVGDYRLICRLEDERGCVLILRVGHRRDVYNT